jgi:hypothetical protein
VVFFKPATQPENTTLSQGWENPTFSNSADWVLGFSMKNPIKPMGFSFPTI